MLDAISLIGAGNMGSALIRGLIMSGKTEGDRITVYDVDAAKVRPLHEEFGVFMAASAAEAILPRTDVLVLAVKPLIVVPVLEEISDRIHNRPLVVSIAAGISTERILSCLPAGARVIRAMPNAAAMVGRSATAFCLGGDADGADAAIALELFSAFGEALVVEEKMLNAVTALSGSGPGYLFAIMEAMVDGGVLLGLDRATARRLTVQTVAGAAAMAAEGGSAFSDLKDRITSPGGTTIAGLQVLERAGVRGILMDAIQAACIRGEELQVRG